MEVLGEILWHRKPGTVEPSLIQYESAQLLKLCTNATCSPVRRRRKSFCRLSLNLSEVFSLNLSEVWRRLQLAVVKIILNCAIAKHQ